MGLLRSRELCYGYHGKMLRAYFEMRHPTSVQINKSPGGGGGGGPLTVWVLGVWWEFVQIGKENLLNC